MPTAHWNQNQWLGGRGYWAGVQLDEVALPVVLAATLDSYGALEGVEIADMIQRALSFIVCNGPSSDQDRWEEDAGINTFTLAACIAALVSGAPYLPPGARELALAIADYWNASLEEWTTVHDTPLARHYGIPGYYIRVSAARSRQRSRGSRSNASHQELGARSGIAGRGADRSGFPAAGAVRIAPRRRSVDRGERSVGGRGTEGARRPTGRVGTVTTTTGMANTTMVRRMTERVVAGPGRSSWASALTMRLLAGAMRFLTF